MPMKAGDNIKNNIIKHFSYLPATLGRISRDNIARRRTSGWHRAKVFLRGWSSLCSGWWSALALQLCGPVSSSKSWFSGSQLHLLARSGLRCRGPGQGSRCHLWSSSLRDLLLFSLPVLRFLSIAISRCPASCPPWSACWTAIPASVTFLVWCFLFSHLPCFIFQSDISDKFTWKKKV